MNAIRRILLDNPMEVFRPLAIFAATFAVGWLVRRLVLRALGAWTERTHSRMGHIMAQALRGPTWIWLLILAAHIAIQSSDLPAKFTDFLPTLLLDLWVASLTLMSMRIAREAVRFYGSQIPGALPVTTLTQNLAQAGVLILGIMVLLGPYVTRLTPILTALGVGGLAVALALQDTLSNLFAGFYVAVAGHIRLGDYIKLNTGEEGYVTDIGWRSTIIRALAHNLIVIPNRTLAQANVTNYHLPEKRMAANVVVTVTFESDPEKVEDVLLEVVRQGCQEIPGLLAEPQPSVHLEPGFGEYSIGFSVNYQVAEFSSQASVRHELRKRIWRRFREEGIQIPLPARMVFMKSEEDLSKP
jgi:small-conductance mechanosensitive channel